MEGTLTVQFVTQENDPESALIRWLSNGLFSHVDLVLPEGLLGARSKGGVLLRPFGYCNFSAMQIQRVTVPDVDKALSFAKAQIGKPYNYEALLDMGLHRTRHFTSDQPSWFCDEFIYTLVAQGGVYLLNTENPLGLTPWEVYLSPLWTKD